MEPISPHTTFDPKVVDIAKKLSLLADETSVFLSSASHDDVKRTPQQLDPIRQQMNCLWDTIMDKDVLSPQALRRLEHSPLTPVVITED